MKKIIMLFLELIIISAMLLGCSKKDSSYSEKIIHYIDEVENETSPVSISMSEFTEFEWDKLIVFEPMASKTEMEKELGFNIDAEIDVFGGIIFFSQDKTVYFSEFKETFDGDCIFKIITNRDAQVGKKYEIVSKESARFNCEKSTNAFGKDSYTLSLI